jgi:DNA polymerase II small subunit/DNA polymerase delta subunit B
MLTNIFAQLDQFFRNYMEEKKRLRELIEQEYQPRLKQKEAALSKKMGQQVKLDPLSDPEYAAIIRNNVGQLKSRYQNTLTQLKKQIEEMLQP